LEGLVQSPYTPVPQGGKYAIQLLPAKKIARFIVYINIDTKLGLPFIPQVLFVLIVDAPLGEFKDQRE
jgi:hypothetical protein